MKKIKQKLLIMTLAGTSCYAADEIWLVKFINETKTPMVIRAYDNTITHTGRVDNVSAWKDFNKEFITIPACGIMDFKATYDNSKWDALLNIIYSGAYTGSIKIAAYYPVFPLRYNNTYPSDIINVNAQGQSAMDWIGTTNKICQNSDRFDCVLPQLMEPNRIRTTQIFKPYTGSPNLRDNEHITARDYSKIFKDSVDIKAYANVLFKPRTIDETCPLTFNRLDSIVAEYLPATFIQNRKAFIDMSTSGAGQTMDATQKNWPVNKLASGGFYMKDYPFSYELDNFNTEIRIIESSVTANEDNATSKTLNSGSTLVNNTDLNQTLKSAPISYNTSIITTTTTSLGFSENWKVGGKTSFKAKVGVPLVGEGEVTVEISGEYGQTFSEGTSNSYTTTASETYTLPEQIILVPAHSSAKVSSTVKITPISMKFAFSGVVKNTPLMTSIGGVLVPDITGYQNTPTWMFYTILQNYGDAFYLPETPIKVNLYDILSTNRQNLPDGITWDEKAQVYKLNGEGTITSQYGIMSEVSVECSPKRCEAPVNLNSKLLKTTPKGYIYEQENVMQRVNPQDNSI